MLKSNEKYDRKEFHDSPTVTFIKWLISVFYVFNSIKFNVNLFLSLNKKVYNYVLHSLKDGTDFAFQLP